MLGKLEYFLVILMICYGVQGDDEGNANFIITLSRKIENFFENKCLKNADGNAYADLENTTDTKTCIMKSVQLIEAEKDKDNVIKMVCNKFRAEMYKCYTGLVQKLEPCLDAEEKYLPDFLLGAHNISYEESCVDDGKYLEDLVAKLKEEKCNIPMLYLPSLILPSCLPKLKLVENLGKPDYVIRKTDLCSDLDTAKKCFMKSTKEFCGEETVYLEITAFVFDTYLIQCNKTV